MQDIVTVSIGKLELTILMPTYLDSFPRVRNLVYYLRNMQICSCVQKKHYVYLPQVRYTLQPSVHILGTW